VQRAAARRVKQLRLLCAHGLRARASVQLRIPGLGAGSATSFGHPGADDLERRNGRRGYGSQCRGMRADLWTLLVRRRLPSAQARVRVVRVPSTYYVAWWNLESLFDEENSPRRSEKLQRAIGADLAGWTPARRDRKVAHLASVIAQMTAGPARTCSGSAKSRTASSSISSSAPSTRGCRDATTPSSVPTPVTRAGSTSPSSTARDSSKRPTTRSSSTS
jgi:hypothetical protein